MLNYVDLAVKLVRHLELEGGRPTVGKDGMETRGEKWTFVRKQRVLSTRRGWAAGCLGLFCVWKRRGAQSLLNASEPKVCDAGTELFLK